MKMDTHEKSATWEKIWYLQDKDQKTGEYNYFTGLRAEEREELLVLLYDLLDYERGVSVGDRLGSIDESDDIRTGEDAEERDAADLDLGLYDPRQYSFGEGRVWIPWAEDAPSGPKRGQYRDGYPRGLVIHWTAGHRNGLKAGNELMRSTGMLYLIGDEDGKIAQSDSLKYHGYHAGKSSHKFANGYVSDEYAGLELQAAGMLTKKRGKYVTWFGTEIPEGEVRVSERRENIAPGAYHVYTQAQLWVTRKLVCWLYLNNPTVFSIDRVVGHDEVSPGRKVDPGGSIVYDGDVLTMAQFRKLCWNDVDQITESRKRKAVTHFTN